MVLATLRCPMVATSIMSSVPLDGMEVGHLKNCLLLARGSRSMKRLKQLINEVKGEKAHREAVAKGLKYKGFGYWV